MQWPRRVVLAVALVTAALLSAALVGQGAHPSLQGGLVLTFAAGLGLPSTVLALLLARRDAGDRVAPLVALAGLVPGLSALGDTSQSLESRTPLHDYAVAASQGAWVLWYVPIALLVLLFPDGRLRCRRDAWVLRALLTAALVFMVVAAAAPGPYLAPNEAAPHAFGTLPPWSEALGLAMLPVLLATLVLTVVSAVARYRAAAGRERIQVKWLLLAAMTLPLTLLGCWASYWLFGRADQGVVVGLVVMYLAVPTVTAIAVLRPDLFDVDRVIASTVLHAVLTAVVLAVFTAANLAAGLFLAGGSTVGAVVATSLSALLLAPLRGRLQRAVDRVFYPSRRAAMTAVDALRRRTSALQSRPEQLEAVLRTALRDPDLQVGFLAPEGGQLVDADGRGLTPGPGAVDVRLGDQRIGSLSSVTRTSRELLREVATAAAPLVEVVRLRLELRRALHEVEASRTRLLRVGYEERQRLERDLHDGAQLRLVSLGIALRLAQRRLPRGDMDIEGLLDEAVAELGTAVSELRQLAQGIRPSCLDDGLKPALALLVDALPIPVELVVEAQGIGSDLETTAFYVASEAISNAVKHSGAARITLTVDARGGQLYVRVRDDGVGGAAQRDGSGLSGLADRVGAHGGTLLVESPAGGGTTVEAILPCAS